MMKLEDWLDDLCVRFVVNIPAEELASIERICFQIEEAQWYYEDFVRPQDPSLPSLSLKPFFVRLTQRCPLFAEWPQDELSNAFERFLKYKNRVPVRGAILLNDKMDQVLLVKGWKKNGTWSFPRGKINKDEDDLDCAIREAWEETGFDVHAAGLVKERKKIKSIEKTMRSQNLKLFVFRGVPQDAKFIPQTRKEISKVEWFKLSELPTEKRKNQADGQGQNMNPNKFYVVAPFMYELKKIISTERKRDSRQTSKLAQASAAGDMPYPIVEQHHTFSPVIPSNLPEVTATSFPGVPSAVVQDEDTKAKSNALLALLQKGPSTQGQLLDDQGHHHTSIVAENFTRSNPDVHSPSAPEAYPHAHPTLQTHAHPILDEHARSLLNVFSQQTQQGLAQQLPLAKQNLLAAFRMPSPQQDNASPDFATSSNSLLQLLQMAQKPEPSTSEALEEKPQPAQSPATVPRPIDSNLLDLLQQPSNPTSVPRSYAAAASSANQVQNTLHAPAELATVAEHKGAVQKPSNLPSATSKPSKAVKNKPSGGAVSATLDRPFDEPRFDVIPQMSADENARREPTSVNKKLFDPSGGQSKQQFSKISLQREDRNRVPKSPRTPRHGPKTVRPSTPKELQKPFQPQILRRPQTSEGEALLGFPDLSNGDATAHKAIEIMSRKPSQPLVPVPSVVDDRISAPVTLADVPSHMVAKQDPQKQALLSLLKTPIKAAEVPVEDDATPRAVPQVTNVNQNVPPPRMEQVISPVMESSVDTTSRSRVSSLASNGHNLTSKPSLQKRETAPNDKAFLLSFLKGMAAES